MQDGREVDAMQLYCIGSIGAASPSFLITPCQYVAVAGSPMAGKLALRLCLTAPISLVLLLKATVPLI